MATRTCLYYLAANDRNSCDKAVDLQLAKTDSLTLLIDLSLHYYHIIVLIDQSESLGASLVFALHIDIMRPY